MPPPAPGPADVVGASVPDQRVAQGESDPKRRRSRVADFLLEVLDFLMDVLFFWRR